MAIWVVGRTVEVIKILIRDVTTLFKTVHLRFALWKVDDGSVTTVNTVWTDVGNPRPSNSASWELLGNGSLEQHWIVYTHRHQSSSWVLAVQWATFRERNHPNKGCPKWRKKESLWTTNTQFSRSGLQPDKSNERNDRERIEQKHHDRRTPLMFVSYLWLF